MATMTTTTVTSRDGTKIAVDIAGSGAPIVLVSGGSVDRGSNAGLAEAPCRTRSSARSRTSRP